MKRPRPSQVHSVRQLLLSLVLALCIPLLAGVAFAAPLEDAVACGRRPIVAPGTITRGQSSWPGQFPWHGALYRVERRLASASYACGCFIVGARALLTAAHCVTDPAGFQLAASELTVRVGLHDLLTLARHTQEHRVQRIVRHGNYSLGSPRHDVALLALRTELEFGAFVQPVCLAGGAAGSVASLRRGLVAGWGLTEGDGLALTLRASSMPTVDYLRCLQSDPALFGQVLYDGMFCAGWANGTNVCNGDSGGAFVAVVDGRWTAYGIVSFTGLREDAPAAAIDGTERPLCDTSSLAGFISIPRYREWIDGVALREGVKLSTGGETPTGSNRPEPPGRERMSEQMCRRYRKSCPRAEDLSYLAYAVSPDPSGVDPLGPSGGHPSRLVIDCFAVLISDRFLLAPASCSGASNNGSGRASKQFIILEAGGRAVDCRIRTFHQHPDFVNNGLPPPAGDADQSNLALIELERKVPLLSTCQFVCVSAGSAEAAGDDLRQIFLYSAVNGSNAPLGSDERPAAQGHRRQQEPEGRTCYDELLAPMVMRQEEEEEEKEAERDTIHYRLVGIVLHRTCGKVRFIRVAPFLDWIERIVWREQ